MFKCGWFDEVCCLCLCWFAGKYCALLSGVIVGFGVRCLDCVSLLCNLDVGCLVMIVVLQFVALGLVGVFWWLLRCAGCCDYG